MSASNQMREALTTLNNTLATLENINTSTAYMIREDDNGNVNITGKTTTVGVSSSALVEGTSFYSSERSYNGYILPLSDGTSGQVLSTDGGKNLSFTDAATGDVSAVANITDKAVVIGNGGAKGVQNSNIYIDGTGIYVEQNMSNHGDTLTFDGGRGLGTDKNGGSVALLGGRATGTGTPGGIEFYTSDAGSISGETLSGVWTEKMRILHNGNVGIGTNNPEQALDVIGNIQGSSNLYIDGNVGVGTSSPVEALTVDGEITLGTEKFLGYNLYWDSDYKAWKDGYSAGIRHDNDDGRLDFMISSSPATAGNAASSLTNGMRLDRNSRLFVGTTTLPSNTSGLNVFCDQNYYASIGRAKVGYCGATDEASFAHYDHNSTSNYAMRQNYNGYTMINAVNGQTISFRFSNQQRIKFTNGNADFIGNTGTQDVVRIRGRTGGYSLNGWNSQWEGGLRIGDMNGWSAYLQYGISTSDDRVKSNEEYIEDATSTIMKIKPEIYDKQSMTDTEYNRLMSEYTIEKTNLEAERDASNDENIKYEIQQKIDDLVPPIQRINKECGLITQQIYYDVPEMRYAIDLNDSNPLPLPDGWNSDPNIDPDYEALGWGEKTCGLNYNCFIGMIIKMNQEQQARIEALEARIQVLENP